MFPTISLTLSTKPQLHRVCYAKLQSQPAKLLMSSHHLHNNRSQFYSIMTKNKMFSILHALHLHLIYKCLGGVVGRYTVPRGLRGLCAAGDIVASQNGAFGAGLLWWSVVQFPVHRWHWPQIHCARRCHHSGYIRSDFGAIRIHGPNWPSRMGHHLLCHSAGIEHRSYTA